MVKYCTHCGAELDDVADVCPECGVSTPDDTSNTSRQILSYAGSVLLLFFAFAAFTPMEGEEIWYTAGTLWLATGVLTLPPIKTLINETSEDLSIDTGTSWGLSLLGFVLGFFAIPV